MSIINDKRSEEQLSIVVNGPFNYFTVELIKAQISSDIQELVLDLSTCDILDSEAAIFLYKWQSSGRKLELIQPPELLFKILHTLELEDSWNVTITNKND